MNMISKFYTFNYNYAFILLSIFFTSSYFDLCAQNREIESLNCDTSIIIELGSQLSYQNRGNRCEGFYISKVTSPTLVLCNLTKGKFFFESSNKEILKVYTNQSNTKYSFQVIANPIPIKLYYRMDAILTSLDTLLWPIGDVLHKFDENFKSSNIGIVGKVVSDTCIDCYIPLIIKSKLSKINNDDIIRAIFRSTVDLGKVVYNFTYQNNNNEFTSESINLNKTFLAGTSIVIEFPSDIGHLSRIYITGRIRGERDEWVDRFIDIY